MFYFFHLTLFLLLSDNFIINCALQLQINRKMVFYHNRYALLAVNGNIRDVGGVYEFVGSSNGPPPELKKLLGIRDDDDSKKKTFKKNKDNKTPTKSTLLKSKINFETLEKKDYISPKSVISRSKTSEVSGDSIDDLERQVLSKYGSNEYQAPKEWEGDDNKMQRDDSSRSKKKFEGVFKSTKNEIKINEKQQVDESKSAPGRMAFGFGRDAGTTITQSSKESIAASSSTASRDSKLRNLQKIEELDDEEESYLEDVLEEEEDEVDPSATRRLAMATEAAPAFRLRPPPPLSPEESARLAKKAVDMAAKELLQVEKRKQKKLLEGSKFVPFSFESGSSDGKSSATGFECIFASKTFLDIGVTDPILLRNLDEMGMFHPTKIQEVAVPALLAGKDVVMQAHTGSGKTMAFLLPLRNVIDPSVRKVQALVLAPSRELVCQIALVGEKLFEGTGINVMPIIGGTNVRNQVERLRDSKPQILVATPGRLAELVFRLEKLRLGMVRAVVCDEIDNLLRESTAGELQTILEATPLFKPSAVTTAYQRDLFRPADSNSDEAAAADSPTDYESSDGFDVADEKAAGGTRGRARLVCFASATANDNSVKAFVDYLSNGGAGWTKVSTGSAAMLPASITHGLMSVPRIKALEMLKKFLVAKPAVTCALVFVNDPYRVELVCDKLLEMGMVAAPLHGDSSKDDRKEVLARLRDGRLSLVVTTELAARGLDIPDLSHVINFELPTDAQHYVHRGGRCGRAGKPGLVMNFATPDTKFVIRRFGKQLGVKILDCELRDGLVHLKQR